jgi:hypothetical protein
MTKEQRDRRNAMIREHKHTDEWRRRDRLRQRMPRLESLDLQFLALRKHLNGKDQ